MLKGKNVVLGITGGIAAYKACDLISMLMSQNATVDVIMTKNATEFVTPLSIESLCKRKAITDTFATVEEYAIEHIALAKKADVFVVCPATANAIGKIANGIADDMLSTTIMATKAPVVICPAMNTAMYESEGCAKNIEILKNRGYIIIDSDVGRLACGDVGKGKLATVTAIYDKIIDVVMPKRDYVGKRVLVSCGATIEHIDPIRFISNRSSGKMGMALVKNAVDRGAEVFCVSGSATAPRVKNVSYIDCISTKEMESVILTMASTFDYIIMAAAPADYTPKIPFVNKYKGDNLVLELVKTPDISAQLGKMKNNFKLCCFAAESIDVVNYAKEKMIKKNADMIVANDVSLEGAGFGVDTNIVTIITRDKELSCPIMTKGQVAVVILDELLKV